MVPEHRAEVTQVLPGMEKKKKLKKNKKRKKFSSNAHLPTKVTSLGAVAVYFYSFLQSGILAQQIYRSSGPG